MTYRSCYEEGSKKLQAAGIEEAALDARLLLEYVCGTCCNDLLLYGDRDVTGEQEARYAKLLAVRQERVPLQYVTGEQEFMGLPFKVNESVLIPRQDTEILVERVCKSIKPGMHILDMCTGSGCIIISILCHTEGCTGVGADISQAALQVAAENGRLLSASSIKRSDALQLVESDLFANIEGKYDRIVSNPPYIRSRDIALLMPEVRDHEPVGALDGSEDGLYFYRLIIQEAHSYLKPEGMLFFEIGYDQAEAVSGMMAAGGYGNIEVIKDYAGSCRVVCGSLEAAGNR